MAVAQHEQQHQQQRQQTAGENTPNQPLNVKEQLEATATRFWSSVTMKDESSTRTPAESIKVPGVPVGLFSKSDNSEEHTKKRSFHTAPNSLQQVMNAMFSSCTAMGAQFNEEGSLHEESGIQKTKVPRSRTGPTPSITPSSNAEVVTPSPQRQQTPLPRPSASARSALQETSKNIFKNNHEIAEEAIKHLRQQQYRENTTQMIVANDSVFESEVAVDMERETFLRSNTNNLLKTALEPKLLDQKQKDPQSRNPFRPKPITTTTTTTTTNTSKAKMEGNLPSPIAPFRSRKGHSFFPASKPRDPPGATRQEQRAREKKERIKGVPKEVEKATKPLRIFKKRNKHHQKRTLNNVPGSKGAGSDGAESDDTDSQTKRSWDIDNDGISDITQATVDRMMFAIEQQLLVFPEEADNFNRIHSDLTDQAPVGWTNSENDSETNLTNPNIALSVGPSDTQDFFPMLGGTVAGFNDFRRVVTPPRGGDSPGKAMSPSLFTRNAGSLGTRSFFTKTTHSTQTTNFASAWRKDEQQFWDTEVAKEQGKPEQASHSRSRSRSKSTKGKKTSVSPGGKSWVKFHKNRRSGGTAATTSITTATTPSPKHARKYQQLHEDHTSREVSFTDHDRLMDNLILQTEVEMAEI
mmetsp:Transcript_6536/g.13890  ORF Transcript_6536/g.13890 Transcript_6536/m.13890 type:complete len:636 (+) Transcript_6536:715-2622(+)|eukprot:CAMPEP_0168174062 /NCGR_PEP_ID=MMETSP0139_2-20121125/6273_1 /TAXON_ID=44445 /ORGANISM="Pseudo-nitzschia australis, Strain 10249 10 AB" /LENGTH=635 /DNA_ID=CAMNT_0008092127 /DNA_START=653 /DNA_END=2560 /DNA_ORIENTATION=+